jgi:hypothetical protein
MVSWIVEMTLRPGWGIWDDTGVVSLGWRRINALEVFFCRRLHDRGPHFRIAEVAEDANLSLAITYSC